MLRILVFVLSLGARALRAICRRRADLVLENLALRQQVTALNGERPRPALDDVDRAFWVALRRSWPPWASRLVIVNADTVARWHRERFRRYWAMISRRRYPGRPRTDVEIRRLVRLMAHDGWGAPRIHAELLKLGFVVSEMTVSRYIVCHLYSFGRVGDARGAAMTTVSVSSTARQSLPGIAKAAGLGFGKM